MSFSLADIGNILNEGLPLPEPLLRLPSRQRTGHRRGGPV